MIERTRTIKRGLTLVELMLALAITAIVGLAITSVLGAVVNGVDTRRDNRSHIVRAHMAQSRLGAYIIPSRAFLHVDDDLIVLWFDDSRQSGSVHGSEIRWIEFDGLSSTVTLSYVEFPENWTTAQRWLEDREHEPTSNWGTVRAEYAADGHITTTMLVDGVSAMRVATDDADPLASRHVVIRLTLANEGGATTSQVSGTLRKHAPPER